MPAPNPKKSHRLALKLGLVAVAMFLFALFALPPLYDIICQVFGIGGKSLGAGTAQTRAVDRSRDVTVEFLADVYQGTPLDFRAPSPFKATVHPGQLTAATYLARNLTDRPLWAQAVHSISPGEVGKFMNAVECFCFKKQKFEPGEERRLSFAFSVSPQLPTRYTTISVSYTFFKLNTPPEDKP
jgi:cytochrome c oxidase assembly protein subunit 11